MNNKKAILAGRRGFTLIEILLYISIASALMLLMSAFLFILLQGKIKSKTISEVNNQGIQAMQIISQVITGAESIGFPSQGSSGSSLTLNMADLGKNPTVISSDGNNIQIKEGTGAVTSLTNSQVKISNLNFSNLSRAGSSGLVKIKFTISSDNQSGRNEYDFTQDFYKTIKLR